VCRHSVGDLLFRNHPLNLSQDRFAFGQSEPQRLRFEFSSLQIGDLVYLLLPVLADRHNTDLEDHATTSCPMARSFRLISLRWKRCG
jgi:hypothetical protein